MNRLVVFALPFACAACEYVSNVPPPAAPPLLEVARARARFDFASCPSDQVQLTPDHAANTVDVRACGKHVVYRCPEQAEFRGMREPRSPEVYRTCQPEVRVDEKPCPPQSG